MRRLHEPTEGWDEYARRSPEGPLSKNAAQSYLSHVIDQQNAYARYLDEVVMWKALPWWRRLITPRPRRR